ncbi:CocE/NonD family hydrolase [Streptomyces sp. ME19-01-6]|uniref:CocE/NonD family hydrolase n=1 Tax=Streptomyces sp. ME19-01-6 TaxID=3028686 RepID=UPI0029A0F5B1|nr:CocE/NonD family hydrolase [Streptomyces sp. ME19-01-6]MDX3225373.1 CocE/NonD family hydrolase [Streptomyces sp. ME19-01-6]
MSRPRCVTARCRAEESDGYDTVRWAAALPGSNGSVSMIGGSYCALVAHAGHRYADAPTRYRSGRVGGITGLVQDFDGLAGCGYGKLPAGRFPASARHDLPELGYERSRREAEWAARARLTTSPPCAAPTGPPRRPWARGRAPTGGT